MLHFFKMEVIIYCFTDGVTIPGFLSSPPCPLHSPNLLTDVSELQTLQLQKQLPPWQLSELSPSTSSTSQPGITNSPTLFHCLKNSVPLYPACNCQHSLHCLLFLLHSLYTAFEYNQVLTTDQITEGQNRRSQLNQNGPLKALAWGTTTAEALTSGNCSSNHWHTLTAE